MFEMDGQQRMLEKPMWIVDERKMLHLGICLVMACDSEQAGGMFAYLKGRMALFTYLI